MDKENISHGQDPFISQLMELRMRGDSVQLFFDCMGMERREGIIAEISTKDDRTYLEMDNGDEIDVDLIVSVNGFSRDNIK